MEQLNSDSVFEVTSPAIFLRSSGAHNPVLGWTWAMLGVSVSHFALSLLMANKPAILSVHWSLGLLGVLAAPMALIAMVQQQWPDTGWAYRAQLAAWSLTIIHLVLPFFRVSDSWLTVTMLLVVLGALASSIAVHTRCHLALDETRPSRG